MYKLTFKKVKIKFPTNIIIEGRRIMNYYDEIKNKIINNETYSMVKEYSKERHKVITYFEIGKLLTEAGGKYGDNIIDEYSKKLVKEVGKKYNRRTLFRMKQFYNIFSNEKVSPLVTQLTWTHYVILLSLNDYNKINYYMKQVSTRNLSKRELEQIIKMNEYERLSEDAKNKLNNKEDLNIINYVKSPILIRNNNNYEIFSEKILQKIILEDIESFMNELGNSFSFVGSEYKIKLGENYNYIDLLLFNYEYNCFVVIELKITELKKEEYRTKMKKTGKVYTFDRLPASPVNFNKPIRPICYDELVYNNQKYIRLWENCDRYLWINVEPITWLIDEKTGLLISKKILLSGIRFAERLSDTSDFSNSDMKYYLDNFMKYEILSHDSLEYIDKRLRELTKEKTKLEKLREELLKDKSLSKRKIKTK